MEDEIKYDDLFTTLNSGGKPSKNLPDLPDTKVFGYNTKLGKSKYDTFLDPNSNINPDDLFNTLSSYRSIHQPTSHKVGNALARLTNVLPEAIGSVASALDFEDYFNQNDEVGNWLTRLTEEWKQSTNEALPIYRENPGKALDFGDVGWWLENGSALGQSIGGFGVGGGVISKGLSGLSKITKARKLATKMMGLKNAEKLGDGVKTVATAGMLNQAESILEATSVYDDIYNEKLQEYLEQGVENPEDLARNDAAEAASATVRANRVNILLNLTSANLFIKSPRLSRKLMQKDSFKKTSMMALGEGVQESGEEFVNFISGEYGRAVGRDQDYGIADIIDALSDPHAQEAALLGFLGGLGQTVITKEGVNRLQKVTDPETGERISVKEYNKRAYENQQKEFTKYDEMAERKDVKSFTDVFNSTVQNIELSKQYDEAVKKGDDAKANEIAQLSLGAQAFHAFKTGSTEGLIELYENLAKGEQKEGMPDNYAEKARQAISKIKSLEKIYNDTAKYENHQQVYLNKAYQYDLVEHNNEISKEISENSLKLKKLTDALLKNTMFDPSKDNLYTFTLDQMLGDINKEGATQTKSYKDALKKYEEIKSKIQNTIEYSISSELSEAQTSILNRLNDAIKKEKTITSDAFQKMFKNLKTRKSEMAKKRLDEQVDEAEKSIKEDEIKAKKAEDKAVADKINQNVEDEVSQAEDATDKANEALTKLADKYKEGETISLDELGDEFKDIVGTVTKVSKTSDGRTSVEITTESGEIISLGDGVSPRYKNNDVNPVYDTEGPKGINNSNESSVESSRKNDEAKDTKKNSQVLSDVKMMSTNKDTGEILPGIPKEFVEFERNGVDKKGTKVTFEINTDLKTSSNKNSKFKQTLDIYNKIKNGESVTTDEKVLMVDYLPIKLKINDSNDIYTFLMSKPNTDNKDAQLAYNNRTRPMRVALIKALIDGNDIKSLYTTIKGQYGGQLNMDDVTAKNNPLDLQYINGDVNKVELGVLDELGQLMNDQGEFLPNWNPSKAKDNWKGSVYMKIKKANGDDFYIKLNHGKVTDSQADSIFDIYKELINSNIVAKSTIDKLPDNVKKDLYKNLKPEIDLISKLNGIKPGDITVTQLLDVIFWDGSTSKKSKLRFNYENETISMGDKTYTKNEFTESKREEFVNWVTKNKNRNFKFKNRVNDANNKVISSNPEYIKYAFNNGVLTTNAKVKEPSFIGFTNLYMNNGIAGVKVIKTKPKAESKVKSDLNVVKSKGEIFNKNIDTNMSFATVDGKNYHISINSGRVFSDTGYVPGPGQFSTPEKQIGDLIKNNDLISKIEQAVRSNPFIPNPNATLKRYDVPIHNTDEIKLTPAVKKAYDELLKDYEEGDYTKADYIKELNDLVTSLNNSPKNKAIKKGAIKLINELSEKSEDISLKSQEKTVSLQEGGETLSSTIEDNELTDEAPKKPAKPKRKRALSRKERAERALASKNKDLNTKCKNSK